MKKYITLVLLSWLIHSHIYGQQNPDSQKTEIEEKEEEYYDDILGRAAHEAILQGQLPGKEFNYSRARWDAYLNLQKTLGAGNAKVDNINGNWSFIGPEMISPGAGGIGRVQAIEIISNTEWLVATAQGGLWKTTDAGSTWSCLTDGLPNLSITDLDVDPNNSDVIYILTGDRDGSASSQKGPPGIGILKSVNGGLTWLSTGMFFEREEQFFGDRIEVDPNNSNRVWATIKDGIYVSENGGLEFTLSLEGGFRDLELMPGNPDFVLASGTSSVWYRESPGSNWVQSTGLEDVENASRLLISYAPSNPDKVYAIYAGAKSAYYRIYRSYNGGISFTEFDTDTIDIFSEQAYYDMAFTVDPNDENTLYTGAVWLYKSIDGGDTWTLSSCQVCDDLPYVHPDIHGLEMTTDGVLLIGNDGGIYRSFEDTILDVSNGLHITQLYHLTTLTSDIDVIAAGAQDNGILLKKAGKPNFANLKQVDGFETIFVNGDNVFFSEAQKGWLYLHELDGDLTEISPEKDGVWDTPLIRDPNDPHTVYICYDTIYRIIYIGIFGVAISDMITTSPNNTNIIEAAIGISNISRFYTFERATIEQDSTTENWGFIHRSDNFQTFLPTFDSVYSSQDFYLLTDIVVDPANSLRIWVTIGGYTDGKKVYFSDDGGDNFTNVSGSLPNVPAFCISYVPGSDDGLYVGTDVGVFYKDNNLGDWIPFQNGLPVASVREIEVLNAKGLIRAATMGRGLWQSEMFTGECEDTINILDGEYDEGFNIVQVTELVTSVAILDQGIGTDVTYDAGDAIYLHEGFEVKSSGVFTAKIDGCQSLVSKYAALTGTYEGPMTGFQSDPAATQSSIDISLYPNPAHKQVTVEFSLESESKVSIYILDEMGRAIYCLADGEKYLEGNHLIRFDTSNLPASIYSIRLFSSSGPGFAKLDVIH